MAPRTMHTGYDVYCDMVLDGGGWLVSFESKYGFTFMYINFSINKMLNNICDEKK